MRKAFGFSCAQVGLGGILFLAGWLEWGLWWLPGVLWAVLSILGFLLTLPLWVLIGIGAGAAQADWMSDQFVFVVFVLLSTVLAVGANFFIAWLNSRGDWGDA